MKIFLMSLLLNIVLNNVQIVKKPLLSQKESKKLQIQFTRSATPTKISTSHQIKKVKTDGDFVITNTELGQSDNASFDSMDAGSEESDNFSQESQGITVSEEVTDDDKPKNPLNDMGDVDYEDLSEGKGNKNLKIAFNQVGELEGELKGALHKNDKNPVMLSPNVLKTLVSYLEHLDYIHKHEEGKGEEVGLPPSIPSHLRSQGYEPEPLEEDIKSEGEEDISEEESLEDNSEEEQTNGEDNDKDQEDKEQEEFVNDKYNKIYDKIKQLIEETEKDKEVSKDKLEFLHQKENTLREKLQEYKDFLNTLKVKFEKEEDIYNQYQQIQNDIASFLNEIDILQKEEDLETAKEEIDSAKEGVLNEEIQAAENENAKELKEFEEEMKKLESEQESIEEKLIDLEKLEKIEKRIIEVEEQIKQLSESGVDIEMLQKLQNELIQLQKEQLEMQNKIKNRKDSSDSSEEKDKSDSSDSSESSKEKEKEEIKVNDKDTTKSSTNTKDEDKSKEEKDKNNKFTINTLEKSIVKVNKLRDKLNKLFKNLPQENQIPKDSIKDMKKGLLLFENLKQFIINITENKKDYENLVKELKSELEIPTFGYQETLKLYSQEANYNKYLPKIKNGDKNFELKKEEISKISEKNQENIVSTQKNANTLQTLIKLIEETTDPLIKDKDIDAIDKVQKSIQAGPKLIILKKEADEALNEIEKSLQEVTGKKTIIEKIVLEIAKISRGEMEPKKDVLKASSLFILASQILLFII